ncbi:MAG: selenium cofactor biosynthesis protein YqeC [Anaerolineae bacterium]
MKLHQAFGVQRGDIVAFVGAGGKTSTMVALAHELAERGWRVLATTTTRLGADQAELFPRALTDRDSPERLSAALETDRIVLVHGGISNDKTHAPSAVWLAEMPDQVDSDVLLVEADGARGLPLKAPRPHEPAIPHTATLVVPIAGMSVLGQPFDEAHIMNAAALEEAFGFPIGASVKSPWVAQALRDPAFGLKNVPDHARVVAWLNGAARDGYQRGRARLIAQLILAEPRVSAVALGSARASDPAYEVQRRVGAVVLAAGLSSRMGQSKVLLPWENGTILEHILHQLVLARIRETVVVTGHRAEDVARAASTYEAAPAFNPDYAKGEMLSSLQTGLRALPAHISAALIVLGDQPRLQPAVVTALTAAYAEGKGDIIAPSFQHRRGHPMLIDRRYWPELLDLTDGAPRDVINRHADRIHYVNVNTDSILRDVDTPDDYDEERRRAGLE